MNMLDQTDAMKLRTKQFAFCAASVLPNTIKELESRVAMSQSLNLSMNQSHVSLRS